MVEGWMAFFRHFIIPSLPGLRDRDVSKLGASLTLSLTWLLFRFLTNEGPKAGEICHGNNQDSLKILMSSEDFQGKNNSTSNLFWNLEGDASGEVDVNVC